MAKKEENPFGDILFSEARGCGGKFEISRELRTIQATEHSEDCQNCSSCVGSKMGCGHFFCPDCLLNWAWILLSRMKQEIVCSVCSKCIPIDDIIKFGMPCQKEILFLTTAITTNFYMSQDINSCPNCQTLCSRKAENNVQVNCIVCPKQGRGDYLFCWYCLRRWNDPGNNKICGNKDCKREEVEILINAQMKSYDNVEFPSIRACPNKSCNTLCSHEEKCPATSCKKCSKRFCFVCLSMGSDGSLACTVFFNKGVVCSLAPRQTKLW